MPEAKLPSTPAGWAVALVASLAGFLAGLVTIALFNRFMG
jgi:hypothetical protein